MSAGHMSSYGLDSKSAAYLTKKNTLANHINPTNYLNIVFIILFLVILTYGIYKFKKE